MFEWKCIIPDKWFDSFCGAIRKFTVQLAN